MPIFGANPTGRKWVSGIVRSGLDAPAEQYTIDPRLPFLGQDPMIPNNDYVVMPRGRNLSVVNTQSIANSLPAYANVNRPILTLANGSDGLTASDGTPTDLKPMGFSEQQYFRQWEETIQGYPQLTKNKLIEVPYIQASNGAYGALKPGDRTTAYYGSATSGSPVANEVGKFVKWVPRHVYTQHQASAATTITLAQAVYPAFKPNVIMAFNAGAVVVITSATAAFVGGTWVLTLNAAVTDVIYDWGQDADNISGQVSSFEAVGTAGGALTTGHNFQGWLQWVNDNFSMWPFPIQATPRPYSTSTNETPTNIGPNQYRLTYFPIVTANAVTITVTGTRVDPLTGASAAITNYVLPLANTNYFQNYTFGQDYELNPLIGVLTLSSNITVSALTVSYSYETSYRDGKLYNFGQLGLTDGRYSGVPGTPANLEYLGVLAAMRIMTI